MAKSTPFEDCVIEVKYGHDEISDGGFGGTYYSTQRAMKANVSISVDARVDPTQHPEIRRLMTALFNNTAVVVRDLPGEWLVNSVERVEHDFGHTVRMDFSLVQALPHRKSLIGPTFAPPEPPGPPEPPEKVAARKLAKRILGYDPSAPSKKPSMLGVSFEVSFDGLRTSFDSLSKALASAGINTASAAASAAKLQAHIEQELLNSYSFQVELDADWPVKWCPKKKDGG
jgi:hypothetical protein